MNVNVFNSTELRDIISNSFAAKDKDTVKPVFKFLNKKVLFNEKKIGCANLKIINKLKNQDRYK